MKWADDGLKKLEEIGLFDVADMAREVAESYGNPHGKNNVLVTDKFKGLQGLRTMCGNTQGINFDDEVIVFLEKNASFVIAILAPNEITGMAIKWKETDVHQRGCPCCGATVDDEYDDDECPKCDLDFIYEDYGLLSEQFCYLIERKGGSLRAEGGGEQWETFESE